MSLKVANWAREEGSQRMVEYFLVKAAIATKGETVGAGITEQEHVYRNDLANKIFARDYNLLCYTLAVASTGSMPTNIEGDDTAQIAADMEFCVNSCFSKFAGYDRETV